MVIGKIATTANFEVFKPLSFTKQLWPAHLTFLSIAYSAYKMRHVSCISVLQNWSAYMAKSVSSAQEINRRRTRSTLIRFACKKQLNRMSQMAIAYVFQMRARKQKNSDIPNRKWYATISLPPQKFVNTHKEIEIKYCNHHLLNQIVSLRLSSTEKSIFRPTEYANFNKPSAMWQWKDPDWYQFCGVVYKPHGLSFWGCMRHNRPGLHGTLPLNGDLLIWASNKGGPLTIRPRAHGNI